VTGVQTCALPILKTFVSFDMLHDSQEHIKTEIYDNLIKYRAEIQ